MNPSGNEHLFVASTPLIFFPIEPRPDGVYWRRKTYTITLHTLYAYQLRVQVFFLRSLTACGSTLSLWGWARGGYTILFQKELWYLPNAKGIQESPTLIFLFMTSTHQATRTSHLNPTSCHFSTAGECVSTSCLIDLRDAEDKLSHPPTTALTTAPLLRRIAVTRLQDLSVVQHHPA